MWANNGGHNKGTGEGWINARGYRETKVDGRTVKEHRAIVEEATGEKLHPDFDVHHINGDKTDNRLENLEIIPHGEHSSFHNLTRAHRSGYTLNLSQDERLARSLRAADLHKAGKLMPPQALAKARGE
jgi:hypothetical protein